MSLCPLSSALSSLLEKYDVSPPPWRFGPANGSNDAARLVLVPCDEFQAGSSSHVPLFPWRHARRFTELRGLVERGQIGTPLSCRFGYFVPKTVPSVDNLLFREFDLFEWITGEAITEIHTSMNGPRTANVIIQGKGGIVGAIETGATLPVDADPIDRHEIVASDGIASDRVVDVKTPAHSVMLFADDAAATFDDVDAELFGLNVEEVGLVRAAYAILTGDETPEAMRNRWKRLDSLVKNAFESADRGETVNADAEPNGGAA